MAGLFPLGHIRRSGTVQQSIHSVCFYSSSLDKEAMSQGYSFCHDSTEYNASTEKSSGKPERQPSAQPFTQAPPISTLQTLLSTLSTLALFSPIV
ncbi:unnamed protein product [[Candida] boidinii]|nr:unnamed protein product [[Candida] boidinii]